MGLADVGTQLSPLCSLEKSEVGAEAVGFLAGEWPTGSQDGTYGLVKERCKSY